MSGKFYCRSPHTKDYAETTYAQIFVEMDFNKSFLDEINLTNTDYVWVPKLDYENVLFRYRPCFDTSHLAINCPKAIKKNNTSKKNSRKLTWWDGAKLEHYYFQK